MGELRAELVDLKQIQLELARREFWEFFRYMDPDVLPGWWQEHAAGRLQNFYENLVAGNRPILAICAPPQHGKLLADETPVLTTDGWKRHGELCVGDRVYHPSGRSIRVEAVSAPGPARIRMQLSNGEVFRCHERHEWKVYNRDRKGWEIREAWSLMAPGVRIHKGPKGKRSGRYTFQLPKIEPLDGPVIDLPLDPYVLGAWLGDGSQTKPAVTHSAGDSAMVEGIEDRGFPIRKQYIHRTTGVLTSYFGGGLKERLDAVGVFTRKTGVRLKHIPDVYLTASLGQRLELLAGLIDSDGYVYQKNGRAVFTSADERLADDFCDLIATFGWRWTKVVEQPKLSSSGIQGKRPFYVIGFNPTLPIPCRLKRKRNSPKPNPRKVSIVDVRTDGTTSWGRCIQVDSPDGMYLAGRTLQPTHNSRLIVDFLAWVMGKRPDLKTIYASFSEVLGVRANLRLQRILDSWRYREIFPKTRLHSRSVVSQSNKPRRNSSLLEFFGEKGSFRNTTVRGSITGEGLDLGVIDDPIKGREEAESANTRQKTWDWFNDDFNTRFSKDAGMLMIATRWHLDDPTGRMIRETEGVEVISYPAIAEEDEENRKKGEALFQEFKPLDFLEARKKAMHISSWLALYQQRPTPREGNVIKLIWLTKRWTTWGKDPIRIVQSWDTASKTTTGSATSACLTLAEFLDRIELWDAWGGRLEITELLRKIKDLHAKWSPTVVLIEDKDSGQQAIQLLRADKKSRIPVIGINPGRLDKVTRMEAETPVLEADGVWLPESELWVADLVEEFTTFPGSITKDRTDAFSQGLKYIRERARTIMVSPVSFSKSSAGGPLR